LIVEWCNTWLKQYVRECDAVAGSVHMRENDGLRLVAEVNIPEKVQRVVEWVPSGKGMAGQALVRGEPIFTCDLQDDSSGAVRPGAKAVDAHAAIALPVQDEAGTIVAVVGIAFAQERPFSSADITSYLVKAKSLMPQIRSGQSASTVRS
jgi:L-methionine (R)-S-oxide reductase